MDYEQTLADTDTGEIVATTLKPFRRWTGESRWVKLYLDVAKRAVRDLGTYEWRVLSFLILDMRVPGNELFASPLGIAEELHIRPSTVYKSLKILVDKGYIARQRKGQYKISEELAWLGQRKEPLQSHPLRARLKGSFTK